MSQNYQQYGGNPYGDGGQQNGSYGGQGHHTQPASGYGSQDPYGQTASSGYGRQPAGGYGAQENPYTQESSYGAAGQQPVAGGYDQQSQGYGQQPGPYGQSPYDTSSGAPVAPASVLSNQDFLMRVDTIKDDIRHLTQYITDIGNTHQKILNSADNSGSQQLDQMVTNTQILNTRIKDQIKVLERDSLKSGKNATKESQIRTLKQSFKRQLEDFQKEEQTYRARYKDQIARQYLIINPEATEAEVQQATDADWGSEGVFQTALKSNRSGAAQSVLGSVRARHNDIQKIENTLIELAQLFTELAEQVAIQEEPIRQTEQQTENVKTDTEAANVHMNKAVDSARHRRKLKWICFWIVVAIIIILAIVLGAVLGTVLKSSGTTNTNTGSGNKQ